jgi:hypothetical protein
MKASSAALVLLAAQQASAETSPVSKVLDLLSGLQSKIIGEGEAAQKEYDEYAEWCDDRSKNVDFEIATGARNVEDLQAHIEEEKATQSELKTKIEELAGGLATDSADLKAATAIRGKESADFAAEEKESSDVISTLERAIRILSREMQKGGASMLQQKNFGTITEALKAMVQASMFSQSDAAQLTALVQSSQESDDDSEEEEAGAPAATVYEGHSGGIIDTLEGLLEKAQEQLAGARQKETSALHNFQMLEQSLQDQIKVANKDKAAASKNLASSGEKQSVAEGDLEVTSKDLAEDKKTLSGLHENCLTRAQDFEAATKSRAEELKALAAAKKTLEETTGGAAAQSYSLLQLSNSNAISSGADLANFEAVRLVRDLARKQKSPELAQLASRMAAAMRLSSGSSDPFAKVKGLINEMITKLEDSAASDASHKAYCDKELSETQASKGEKQTEIAKLSTKIDQMSARSANLKEQVATLQGELAAAAKSQAEWDKFRREENAAYKTNKAEMEEGLNGIKMALKVLRDYYAKSDKPHGAADGAASGIVGLLEVVESDFSKGLAEMNAVEDNAQVTYDAASRENEITTTMKTKDVEYKVKEHVGLDKAVSEATSDRSSVQAELDAIVEYLGKLKDMCVAKAEPYEERARRREAEVNGLKEALKVLDGEAVLLQQSQRSLRGVTRHM